MKQVEINTAKKDVEANLPILALAALKGGASEGGTPLDALLTELATDLLSSRKKEKAKKEQMALNAIQVAKEDKERTTREKRRCSHRNQKGESRLSGQVLSNGQLCLICKFCHQEFFEPPKKEYDQIAPPRDLYPPTDEIGSAVAF
jgi:hypothetical protein